MKIFKQRIEKSFFCGKGHRLAWMLLTVAILRGTSRNYYFNNGFLLVILSN